MYYRMGQQLKKVIQCLIPIIKTIKHKNLYMQLYPTMDWCGNRRGL
jgi:hypothetical protein